MVKGGAIRFNLASALSIVSALLLSLFSNHRSKICTPDWFRRLARGTAGSPHDE
jgi:hypothetical protein